MTTHHSTSTSGDGSAALTRERATRDRTDERPRHRPHSSETRPAAASSRWPADPRVFPESFVWGTATAAFQIEGATAVDGRGPSIWDTFAATPGRVLNGDTGDPAADHYRRYPEDIELMRELGVGAYRFSVAWPRVQPDGSGRPNPAGLDFYDRLVDALLEAGIEPWPTLYHWDLPQPLEDAGGWPARDTAHRFAEYAALMRDTLGDRIAHWSTLNEPWCSSFLGYAAGVHAPGRRDSAAALAAVHHLLLGHGLAAAALREGTGGGRVPLVGLSHNQTVLRPYSQDPADIAAARRADGVRNRIFTGPLFQGSYPADVVEEMAGVSDFGFVQGGDLATISAPLDFLGVNFYAPQWVAASAEGIPPEAVEGGSRRANVGCEDVVVVRRGLPRTGIGWEIDASGLYDVLTRLAVECPGVPLYLTENGAAYPDEVAADGGVHDTDRVAYLEAHLRAVHEAGRAGAPVRGYFVWSLIDNFEWAWGYSQRFGVIHVDYADQTRRVKDSGRWYAEVARSGRLPTTTG